MIVIVPPFSANDANNIRRVLLEQNGVIVYPTETFYALGCAANSVKAVNRIYQIKKREKQRPLLILIDSWGMFNQYAEEIDKDRKNLLSKYWPGPLTAVLKTRSKLAPMLNQTGPYLGIRMTSSSIAQDLIKTLGVPLVGTSANRSMESEISEFQRVKDVFGTDIDIYVDGGKTPGGVPSTVVDMKQPSGFSVIREGAVRL